MRFVLALPCALGLAAALAVPRAAAAHPVGLSRSELVIAGAAVRIALRGSAAEFGLSPGRPGGPPASRAEEVRAATLDRISLRQPGARCALDRSGATLRWEPPDGFVIEGTWTCPRPGDGLAVELGFLFVLPPGHTHLARVRAGGAPEQHVARAGFPSFAVAQREPASARAAAFVRLGVEHILTGLDHLAFLVAVLLLAGTLREVLGVVTSFTVAHSLTLALAVAGPVRLPGRIVEPLIALSIVVVAVENLWLLGRAPEERRRALGHRWLLTFGFGLVHGLGFAGALAGLKLHGTALALALVSFNAGVELGQIAVAGVFVPAIFLLRRGRLAAPVPRLGSAVVGALGLAWLVVRLGGG